MCYQEAAIHLKHYKKICAQCSHPWIELIQTDYFLAGLQLEKNHDFFHTQRIQDYEIIESHSIATDQWNVHIYKVCDCNSFFSSMMLLLALQQNGTLSLSFIHHEWMEWIKFIKVRILDGRIKSHENSIVEWIAIGTQSLNERPLWKNVVSLIKEKKNVVYQFMATNEQLEYFNPNWKYE